LFFSLSHAFNCSVIVFNDCCNVFLFCSTLCDSSPSVLIFVSNSFSLLDNTLFLFSKSALIFFCVIKSFCSSLNELCNFCKLFSNVSFSVCNVEIDFCKFFNSVDLALYLFLLLHLHFVLIEKLVLLNLFLHFVIFQFVFQNLF